MDCNNQHVEIPTAHCRRFNPQGEDIVDGWIAMARAKVLEEPVHASAILANDTEAIVYLDLNDFMAPTGGRKGALLALLRAQAALIGATTFLFISETWSAKLEKLEDRQNLPADLSEAPGRSENLMVVRQTARGTRVKVQELTDAGGGRRRLGEEHEPKAVNLRFDVIPQAGEVH